MCASRVMPSGVNSSYTPSVASSAWYCLTSDAWVCVRMRSKSCTDSDFSSTRIGQPPLQFRNQVARLGKMEGAAGDEQDVVGLDQAVLGG